jgi:hypothetical protein
VHQRNDMTSFFARRHVSSVNATIAAPRANRLDATAQQLYAADNRRATR